jgi:hypothetical protein
MHDIEDPQNQVNREVVESKELLGKECCTCGKILSFKFFRRDSSCRDGVRDQCQQCESAPRMSTEEHTARLRELNYGSHAVKRQRWQNQEDYEDDAARVGRVMHSSDLIRTLKKLVPRLYFVDGRIIGDISIFLTYPCAQPSLDGQSFRYLFYLPSGYMPEFSQYEFDARDIPIRESKRGWRTVLIRLITSGLLTEDVVDRTFGKALGAGGVVYRRNLYEHRNRK